MRRQHDDVFFSLLPVRMCLLRMAPNSIFSFALLYNLDLSAFAPVFPAPVRLPISLR